jgi:hypothetical protein
MDSQPTPVITGGWGEKTRKREIAEVQKQLQKRADSHLSPARIIGRTHGTPTDLIKTET